MSLKFEKNRGIKDKNNVDNDSRLFDNVNLQQDGFLKKIEFLNRYNHPNNKPETLLFSAFPDISSDVDVTNFVLATCFAAQASVLLQSIWEEVFDGEVVSDNAQYVDFLSDIKEYEKLLFLTRDLVESFLCFDDVVREKRLENFASSKKGELFGEVLAFEKKLKNDVKFLSNSLQKTIIPLTRQDMLLKIAHKIKPDCVLEKKCLSDEMSPSLKMIKKACLNLELRDLVFGRVLRYSGIFVIFLGLFSLIFSTPSHISFIIVILGFMIMYPTFKRWNKMFVKYKKFLNAEYYKLKNDSENKVLKACEKFVSVDKLDEFYQGIFEKLNREEKTLK